MCVCVCVCVCDFFQIMWAEGAVDTSHMDESFIHVTSHESRPLCMSHVFACILAGTCVSIGAGFVMAHANESWLI